MEGAIHAFAAVWPDKSGVVVHEDATAVAAVDVNDDGWQDLVVAINDGKPRCYLQQPKDAIEQPRRKKPVVVQLRGAKGNPNAIGATVKASLASGVTSAHAVFAGEGYLTQAPPLIYLAERPSMLEITWPDGETSTFEPDESEANRIVISHPTMDQ